MKKDLLIMFLAGICSPLFAQSIEERTLLTLDPISETVMGPQADYGTSYFLYSPFATFTQAGFAYDGWKEDQAYLPQNGDGLSQGEFFANSLVRLDSISAVTGNVSYHRGVRRNVLWNETSDFEILYPYVAADSVGGDMQKEQYSFMGAYARRLGKVTLAAKMDYRALHEWRSFDPRPRNVTSDFKASVSAGYDIRNYVASVSASYRKYYQGQDIEFLKSSGAKATILHLTGLGSDFRRFAGTSTYCDTKYIGNGFSTSALLQSKGNRGINAGVCYDLLKVTAQLTAQNNAPITEMLDQRLKAFSSYSHDFGRFTLAGALSGEYELRQGSENVIDNVSTGNFLDLMQLTLYRRKVYSLKGDFALAFKDFYVLPSVWFSSCTTRHLYPERKMDWSSMGAEAYAGWTGSFPGGWIADIRAGGGYCANLSSAFFIPVQFTDETIYEAYSLMFEKFSDSYASASLGARVQKTLGSFGALFVGTSLRGMFFQDTGKSLFAKAEVGLAF